MKLLIDNLDGQGAVTYTESVSAEGPLRITRTLNAVTMCSVTLDTSSSGLVVPGRRARVVVLSDEDLTMFTGYVVGEPVMVYAGEGTEGARFHAKLEIASDEWLLDGQATDVGGVGLQQSTGELLRTLTQRAVGGVVDATGVANGVVLGVYVPDVAKSWSENAGAAASAGSAVYRVVGGSLSLAPVGAAVHSLKVGDGSLDVGALETKQLKSMANDVTVSGAPEAAAYVQEIFYGDGTTQNFLLVSAPFRTSPSTIADESFEGPAFDTRIWSVTDSASHLGFVAGGLQMRGGNGLDGQTVLKFIDPVEMGGTLVVEAGSVTLKIGSDGILCGFYSGSIVREECFAGFRVKGTAGLREVVALVNGTEVGAPFTFQEGHRYTFRLRMHCAEIQRVMQSYTVLEEATVRTFGGGVVEAPMQIIFEAQDLGLASNTVATVMYDGVVSASAAKCNFAPVNSVQLMGTMASIRLRRTGSVWMVSTHPDGSMQTRMEGAAGEGVDFSMSSAGLVTFFPGRVPQPGELVTVKYRRSRRAVARLQDAASVAEEAAGGLPGVASWRGKVISPPTRSSLDCENAASAILAFSTLHVAALSGVCGAVNVQQRSDVWPGDVLEIDTGAQQMHVIVRRVEIEDGNAAPELMVYRMHFANDWADAISMKLSLGIASDAVLPVKAATGLSDALANLQDLRVTSVTTAAMQVDAGLSAGNGGGFEVRRRDWDFGPGADQDLVLRSPVRSFSIPRVAQMERYFVRMYDNATPPKYSRFSSAVFVNVPVG